MSEDADIAIDREYLGFSGKLSKTQISDKLRRASCSFVRERLQYDLAEQLIRDGISKDAFTVSVNITPVTTTDPEIIEVAYHPAFDDNVYIRPKVIIEVSGRSMSEPVTPVKLRSFIDEVFTKAPFTEKSLKSVPCYHNAHSLKRCSCCTRNLPSRRRTFVSNVCRDTSTTSAR